MAQSKMSRTSLTIMLVAPPACFSVSFNFTFTCARGRTHTRARKHSHVSEQHLCERARGHRNMGRGTMYVYYGKEEEGAVCMLWGGDI